MQSLVIIFHYFLGMMQRLGLYILSHTGRKRKQYLDRIFVRHCNTDSVLKISCVVKLPGFEMLKSGPDIMNAIQSKGAQARVFSLQAFCKDVKPVVVFP